MYIVLNLKMTPSIEKYNFDGIKT